MKPSKQSRELAGAIAEDHKRRAVDDAKKRAVAQHADYDTFRNMVSAAHLKPLQAPTAAPAGSFLPAWNLLSIDVLRTVSAGEGPATQLTNTSSGEGSTACRTAHTSQEFIREWHRSCRTSDIKYRFLKLCGPAVMASIFKVEITGDLLGQILVVLHQEWSKQHRPTPNSIKIRAPTTAAENASNCQCLQQQEALFVLDLLHSLTGAGRFDLNARLVGSKGRQAASQLCRELGAMLQHASCSDCSNCSSTCSSSDQARPEGPTDCCNGADGQIEQGQQVQDLQVFSQQQQQQQQQHRQRCDALERLAYVRRRLHLPD